MSEHLAAGPSGGNLLGFLAAAGALATLDRVFRDARPRMRWIRADVDWKPVYELDENLSDAELVGAMHRVLAGDGDPEFTELGDNLTVEPVRFRQIASEAARGASARRRRYVDFLAAYGCDLPARSGDTIQDSAFRTMSGAGHQHFLKSMRELVRLTSQSDLQAALFEHWTYSDGTPTMRWDPVDDRRYALRPDDPSTSRSAPIRTVRGANRLAIEALPLFPVMPKRRAAVTTSFLDTTNSRSAQAIVRWPIWTVACTLDAVRALLSHGAVTGARPAAGVLDALGVIEVFASRRQTVGKMRSFTPAVALLASGRISGPG